MPQIELYRARLRHVSSLIGLLISASLLVAGCRVPADIPTITWSQTASSPDGNWVATARSKEGGAFGGSYDVTEVFLKWKSAREPIQVLGFSHDQPKMDIRLDWVDPKHLNVVYGSHASLNFQAIKCDGVAITVQDISGGPIPSTP